MWSASATSRQSSSRVRQAEGGGSGVSRRTPSPCCPSAGRYDVVCPMTSAWDLHRAFPEAQLRVIPDAGHSALEPGILSALLDATDQFRGAA